MDPHIPAEAQQVTNAYAAFLERQYAAGQALPLSRSALPYSKEIIRRSIQTAASALASSGQLTEELRDFLETTYVSLADCVDDELARVMREYRQAMDGLAAEPGLGHGKTGSAAWRQLSETSALVAKITRAMTDEAEALRAEFDEFAALGERGSARS
jgi:hypothetical protein